MLIMRWQDCSNHRKNLGVAERRPSRPSYHPASASTHVGALQISTIRIKAITSERFAVRSKAKSD